MAGKVAIIRLGPLFFSRADAYVYCVLVNRAFNSAFFQLDDPFSSYIYIKLFLKELWFIWVVNINLQACAMKIGGCHNLWYPHNLISGQSKHKIFWETLDIFSILQECVQGNVVLYIFRYYIPPLFNVLQVCNGHFWICCKRIASSAASLKASGPFSRSISRGRSPSGQFFMCISFLPITDLRED